jgi:glycosyltransferase involved in cell wall biosynthesis
MERPADLGILVISYYFPPDAAVGAKRIARFCKYWPESGIRPTVLTIDAESCQKIDASPTQDLGYLHIERVHPSATALELYRRRAERKAKLGAESNGHQSTTGSARRSWRLRDHLFALLQFPDIHRGWYRPAVRAAAHILDKTRLSAVFSSGPPWTTHAVGHAVARKFNLPWIADFRDEWTTNPWRIYSLDSRGLPQWRQNLDWRIEDRWVRHAARVICTTDQQRRALLSVHPHLDGKRVVVISNGLDWDRQSCTLRDLPQSEPRVLLHAGNLYHGRRIDTFCQAVESLVTAKKLTANSANFILMGDIDGGMENQTRESFPFLFQSKTLTIVPRVGWQEAQQKLAEADVLLIFQGDHPSAVPAKFYEYMQTGKPILAIAGQGALRDVVIHTGSGFVAYPDDRDGIASAIENALKARPRPAEEVEQIARQFDFRNLTAALAANIHDAVTQFEPSGSRKADKCDRR